MPNGCPVNSYIFADCYRTDTLGSLCLLNKSRRQHIYTPVLFGIGTKWRKSAELRGDVHGSAPVNFPIAGNATESAHLASFSTNNHLET